MSFFIIYQYCFTLNHQPTLSFWKLNGQRLNLLNNNFNYVALPLKFFIIKITPQVTNIKLLKPSIPKFSNLLASDFPQISDELPPYISKTIKSKIIFQLNFSPEIFIVKSAIYGSKNKKCSVSVIKILGTTAIKNKE